MKRSNSVKISVVVMMIIVILVLVFMSLLEEEVVSRKVITNKQNHRLPHTISPNDERKINSLAEKSDTYKEEISSLAELTISAQNATFGKIQIGLFASTPLTARNFLRYVNGDNKYHVSYVGSQFHRIIPDFVIQGGDLPLTPQQKSTLLIDDEFSALQLKHDSRYLVQMANRGPNTNLSQFCFMLKAAPHLNGKHAVFGKVVSGFDVVDLIEELYLLDPTTDFRISAVHQLAY